MQNEILWVYLFCTSCHVSVRPWNDFAPLAHLHVAPACVPGVLWRLPGLPLRLRSRPFCDLGSRLGRPDPVMRAPEGQNQTAPRLRPHASFPHVSKGRRHEPPTSRSSLLHFLPPPCPCVSASPAFHPTSFSTSFLFFISMELGAASSSFFFRLRSP